MMRRAYSILNVKGIADDGEFVTITGIASTPTVDRLDDIVEPMGAKFLLPMPLLWQHNSKMPVGNVTFARPNKNGIPFEAKLPIIKEAGTLKDRIDEAIQSIRYKLVAAVSIGFAPIKDKFERLKNGGIRFTEWQWLELSLVTIPANADATITSVKSIDDRQRAATGQTLDVVVRLDSSPGASGKNHTPKPTGANMKPKISEQIVAFEQKAAELTQKRADVMEKAAETGATLDAEQKEVFENAGRELKEVDEHVTRLKQMEKANVNAAAPVTENREDPPATKAARTPDIVHGRPQLQKGIGFTRLVMLLAASKGNPTIAIQMGKQRFGDSSPEVINVLRGVEMFGSMSNLIERSAVAAGTTQDSTWASPLAQANVLASEFVEYLRPATILGKFGNNGVPNLRRAPFNVKISRQTAGTSGTFVGEGLPKPVGKLAFDLITLPFAKVATIVVLTDELVRFSNPAAEGIARDDMVAGIAQYLDKRFIDPAYAGVANVSPASITNGASSAASSGVTVAAIDADIKAAINHFASNTLLSLSSLVWIMNPVKAISLSMLRNTDGSKAYPDVGANGGTLMGYPVITSSNVALSGSPTDSFVVLVDASNILLADDGQVSVDISQEASLQMDSAPSAGAQSMVSLWQNNLIGLRAERYIYWMARQTGAVYVITDTNW